MVPIAMARRPSSAPASISASASCRSPDRTSASAAAPVGEPRGPANGARSSGRRPRIPWMTRPVPLVNVIKFETTLVDPGPRFGAPRRRTPRETPGMGAKTAGILHRFRIPSYHPDFANGARASATAPIALPAAARRDPGDWAAGRVPAPPRHRAYRIGRFIRSRLPDIRMRSARRESFGVPRRP